MHNYGTLLNPHYLPIQLGGGGWGSGGCHWCIKLTMPHAIILFLQWYVCTYVYVHTRACMQLHHYISDKHCQSNAFLGLRNMTIQYFLI